MKRIVILLAVIASYLAASPAFAHSINGVDSTSAGKVIKFGPLNLVSGSGTASFASGTATCGVFMPDYTAGAGTTTTYKSYLHGPNVTFYAYDANGGTSTTNFSGSYFIGK